jgi:hypothetical protein
MMLVDHSSDRAEIAVQQVCDSAGGELFADTSEAFDVGKKTPLDCGARPAPRYCLLAG